MQMDTKESNINVGDSRALEGSTET